MAPVHTPAQQSIDLYNRVSLAGLEDSEEAMQCAFQLKALHRQGRLDFPGRVALAMALLIVGERDEALEHIGAAYATRDRTDWVALDALASLLAHVAQREKALQVSREVLTVPGAAKDQGLCDNAAFIAAWAGDIDYLGTLVELGRDVEKATPARLFLEALGENGLLRHFQAVQRIGIDIIRDVQMHAHTTVVSDDAGGQLVATLSYIDGTRARRRDVQQRIDAAIGSYCRFHALDEDMCAVIVTEAPRHPSLGGIGQNSRAA